MDQKLWNALMKFAELKREAFSLTSVEQLRELISKTDYPNGDVAELIVAFMLGNLCRTFDDGLQVFMTAKLDASGVDFCLRRFRQNFYVQLKWNKVNTRLYEDYITVVEAGPDKSFKGALYLKPQKGKFVLFDILTSTMAYDEEEFYDIEEKSPDFIQKCNEAWAIIKR